MERRKHWRRSQKNAQWQWWWVYFTRIQADPHKALNKARITCTLQFAPTVMKNDNQGAIALINNPAKHMRGFGIRTVKQQLCRHVHKTIQKAPAYLKNIWTILRGCLYGSRDGTGRLAGQDVITRDPGMYTFLWYLSHSVYMKPGRFSSRPA